MYRSVAMAWQVLSWIDCLEELHEERIFAVKGKSSWRRLITASGSIACVRFQKDGDKVKRFINELKRGNISFYMFIISVVVILGVAIMGISLYRFCYRTINEDFMKNQELYLKGKMDYHENDMRVLDDIVMQIGYSNANTRFYLKNQPLKARKLIENLNRYQSVSRFFEKVCYLYHEDDYIYDQFTSQETSWFLEKIFFNEEGAKQEFQNKLYNKSYGWKAIAEYQLLKENAYFYQTTGISSDRIVIYLKAVPIYYDATMFFFVSEQYYDQLLSDMMNDPMEQQSFYIMCEDQIIVQRGNAEPEEKALLAEVSGFLGTKEVTIGKEHYLLTVQQGDSKLVYCIIQSMEIFYNKVRTQQWVIFTLVVFCMMLAVLPVVIIFRHMTAKVIQVNTLLKRETNCRNIGDIESGVQMLISTNNRYEQESLQSKKAYFIRNFIRGDYDNETKLGLDAAQAGLVIEDRMYVVMLLGERGDQGVNRARDRMLSLIRDAQGLDGYGISLVGNNQSLFLLFADSREQMEKVILQIFQVGKECCEAFVMSVSDYHTALLDGSVAYLEANNAFDTRFLQSNDQILRFEREAGEEMIQVLPESSLQNLRYALQRKEETLLKSAVDDICQRISQISNSLLAFRLNYNKIVHMLAIEWSTDQNKWMEIYNVFALSQCLTRQDFSELLYDTCQAIMCNSMKQEAGGNEIVEQAIGYMKERYADSGFNMAALAEELSVSTVTLSVAFKNTVGIRPSDYLSNIRMEEAKRLLTDTELLIRDVSIAVGYEDDHVFARRFKKYTGSTPGQYRADRGVYEKR